MASVVLNDILDEMREENRRLGRQLSYALDYINILNQFKLFLDNHCPDLIHDNRLNAVYMQLNEFLFNKDISIEINSDSSIGLTDKQVLNETNAENQMTEEFADKPIVVKTEPKMSSKKNTNRICGKYKYFCDHPGCQYRAVRMQVMRDHKNLHSGVRPYQCTHENCSKAYYMRRGLEKHEKECHSERKKYNCIECGLQVWSRKRLTVHMRKHSGEKPFHCKWDGCDYRTTQEVNLTHHMCKHTGVVPFKCTVEECGAGFIYPSALHRHMIDKHSSEKPVFRCDWEACGMEFGYAKTLRDHKLIHMNLKPFACSWPGCDYSGRRLNSLKRHKVIHTGVKNYVCSWPGCDRRFGRSNSLKEHMYAHNNERRYVCNWPDCGYRTYNSGNLSKHKKQKHLKIKIVSKLQSTQSTL